MMRYGSLLFARDCAPDRSMGGKRSDIGEKDLADRRASELDRRLIALLGQDSRRTYSEMAAILQVSRPMVEERIDKLVRRGVITRFTIELADSAKPEAEGLTAFFHLQLRRPVCRMVYASIAGWPELVGCWSIAGSTDMTVLVRCAAQEELEFLRDRLARHAEVKTLWTALCLKQWHHRLPRSGGPPGERFDDMLPAGL